MAITKQTLLALILCLLALSAFGLPLEDVSNTSVGIELTDDPTNANTEHLTVVITRVDDLITSEGDLLAERQVAVEISFDVIDDVVCLNGNPLTPGTSSITLTGTILASAEILASSKDEAVPDSVDDLPSAFDVGIVTVEVSTVVEYAVAEDGTTPIRRITVTERVIEVEGALLVQTDIRQQILEIALDGSGGIRKFEPVAVDMEAVVQEIPLDVEEEIEPQRTPCGWANVGNSMDRAKEWWASLSTRQRTIISFFTSFSFTFSFLMAALVVSKISRLSRWDGYAPPCEQGVGDDDFGVVDVLVVEAWEYDEDIMDEKRGLLVIS